MCLTSVIEEALLSVLNIPMRPLSTAMKVFTLCVCTFLCCTCPCSSQIITLYEYSNGSSCSRGLLDNYDTYAIRARVDCKNRYRMSNMYLKYKTKHGTEFTSLCVFFYLFETTKSSDVCNVTIGTDDKCVYDIDISVKTSRLLSGATLQAVAVTEGNDQFTSNALTLSELYGITSSTGHLVVNGEKRPTDQLKDVIKVNGRELTIVFVCECEAVPCWITISDDDDSAVVVKGKHYALYKRTFERSTQVKVTIKHAACRLDGEYNIVEFSVQIDVPLGVNDTVIIVLAVLTAVLAVAVIILIVIGVMGYRELRQLRIFRSQSTRVVPVPAPTRKDPSKQRSLALLRSETNRDGDKAAQKDQTKRASKEAKKKPLNPISFKLRESYPLQAPHVNTSNEAADIQINPNLPPGRMEGRRKKTDL
ncbi:unnamed protein product [Lymnaea stagnalis]|uniref:Uncharacterized protein n=1 Tax=Lymnaea stagnalis TaxID=6523 RepID=A0AAV2I8Q9_LYMST